MDATDHNDEAQRQSSSGDILLRPAHSRPSYFDTPTSNAECLTKLLTGQVTDTSIRVTPIIYWYWTAQPGDVVEGQWLKHMEQDAYYYKFVDRVSGRSNRPASLTKITDLTPVTVSVGNKTDILLPSGVITVRQSVNGDGDEIHVKPLTKKDFDISDKSETRWLRDVRKGSICHIMGFKESFFNYKNAEDIWTGSAKDAQKEIRFIRDRS